MEGKYHYTQGSHFYWARAKGNGIVVLGRTCRTREGAKRSWIALAKKHNFHEWKWEGEN